LLSGKNGHLKTNRLKLWGFRMPCLPTPSNQIVNGERDE
jgi:hypothetical protein